MLLDTLDGLGSERRDVSVLFLYLFSGARGEEVLYQAEVGSVLDDELSKTKHTLSRSFSSWGVQMVVGCSGSWKRFKRMRLTWMESIRL